MLPAYHKQDTAKGTTGNRMTDVLKNLTLWSAANTGPDQEDYDRSDSFIDDSEENVEVILYVFNNDTGRRGGSWSHH